MKAAADRTARSASARGGFTAADYGTGSAGSIQARVAALDWNAIEESLWRFGYAKAGPVLTPAECAELIAMYADDGRFRSRVDMARFKFGVGDYQYFAAPLPPLVQALRAGGGPARLLPRDRPPGGEPRALRLAVHAGRHLPRRKVKPRAHLPKGERPLIAIVCVVGALRIFVFSAPPPPFHSADEVF